MILRLMMVMIMIMTYGKKYLTTKSMFRAYWLISFLENCGAQEWYSMNSIYVLKMYVCSINVK
jgi:hypothetical protein